VIDYEKKIATVKWCASFDRRKNNVGGYNNNNDSGSVSYEPLHFVQIAILKMRKCDAYGRAIVDLKDPCYGEDHHLTMSTDDNVMLGEICERLNNSSNDGGNGKGNGEDSDVDSIVKSILEGDNIKKLFEKEEQEMRGFKIFILEEYLHPFYNYNQIEEFLEHGAEEKPMQDRLKLRQKSYSKGELGDST